MTLVQTEPKKIYIRVDQQWWQPWANTVAYYPLTSVSTVNDMKTSGTKYNLTNTWVTFGTYQGVDCAYLSTSSQLSNTSFNELHWALPRTFSFWVYDKGNSSSWEWVYVFHWKTQKTNQMVLVFRWGNKYQISQWGSSWNFWAPTFWQWTYHCVIYDGTKFEWFKNWTSIWTWTYTINTQWNELYFWKHDNLWNSMDGYFSNIIIENKVWTAQDVSDYYDISKANYWL
jgi:hypothetical protein